MKGTCGTSSMHRMKACQRSYQVVHKDTGPKGVAFNDVMVQYKVQVHWEDAPQVGA